VKFFDLSATEVGGRVRVRLSLKDSVEDDCSSCLAKRGKFFHRILGVFLVALWIDPNQNYVLNAELSVFDLGYVLEFGSKTVYSPERDAVGEVHLPDSRGIGVINVVCHVVSGYGTVCGVAM
jgi:hypothetical protein